MKIIKNYFYWRDKRRQRLMLKWGKTYYFKKMSINDKFECELLSFTPNDGEYHHLALSVDMWAKKDKGGKSQKANTRIEEVSVYLDSKVVSNGKNHD